MTWRQRVLSKHKMTLHAAVQQVKPWDNKCQYVPPPQSAARKLSPAAIVNLRKMLLAQAQLG